MKVKSNNIIVNVTEKEKNGKTDGDEKDTKIRPNFEAVQLAVLNAERLYFDSMNVSAPTKMALLELSLEEISKAWGMLLSFEKMEFDKNPQLLVQYFKQSHISRDKYNDVIKQKTDFLKEFYQGFDPDKFMQFFDDDSFERHDKKIQFLSRFIEYTREFTIPVIRASSDRYKLLGDMVGRYVRLSPNELKNADKFIDKILKIDEKQLNDIIEIKNKSLYLAKVGDIFVSPSSYPFVTDQAENLLMVLIVAIRVEITLFANTVERMV